MPPHQVVAAPFSLSRRSAIGALTVLAFRPAMAQQVMRIGIADNDTSQVIAPMLIKAYARLGLTLQPEIIPLRRGLKQAEAGILDGDLMRTSGALAEVQGLIRVNVPLFDMAICAYTRGESCPARISWEELGQHKVSILRGQRATEMNLPVRQQLGARDYPDVVRQLRQGVAEYAAGSEVSLDLTLMRQGGKGICKVPEPVERFSLFHALNKRYADLVPRLERVLEEMRQSGEMARICSTELKKLQESARKEFASNRAE